MVVGSSGTAGGSGANGGRAVSEYCRRRRSKGAGSSCVLRSIRSISSVMAPVERGLGGGKTSGPAE